MNIGFIGFGAMGKVHAHSASSVKYFYPDAQFEATLYGVAAATPAHSRAYAEKYGFQYSYADYRELIEDKDVDVVDICTPNVFHFEELMYALENGKHVYCEKPICTSYADAKKVLEAQKAAGTVCGVVFNTRHLLPVIRAKELISSGKLGRILSYDFSFLHSSATDPSRTGWKQDRDVCGGGVLFDLGSHAVDLAEYLCGKISLVSGKSQIAYPIRRSYDGRDDWETNADEAFYLRCTGVSGEIGTVRVGKIFCGTNDNFTFEIYGTLGSLKFDLMEPNWLRFYDASSDSSVRGETRIECVGKYPDASNFPGRSAPVGWLRGHVGSMYNFLKCVHSGVEPSPSFADGARNLAVLEAAYRSDGDGGREVEVTE